MPLCFDVFTQVSYLIFKKFGVIKSIFHESNVSSDVLLYVVEQDSSWEIRVFNAIVLVEKTV